MGIVAKIGEKSLKDKNVHTNVILQLVKCDEGNQMLLTCQLKELQKYCLYQ